MKRWFVSCLVALLALSVPRAALAEPADGAPKWNFVLVLIDDLGRNDVSLYGNPYFSTPHIDRLAERGMHFTQAYAAPVCSPTRAGLLTGQHPARLNVTDWLPGLKPRPEDKLVAPKLSPGLPPETVTLAERLRRLGYVTGIFGKWHLGAGKSAPDKLGFDVIVGGTPGGTPPKGYFNFDAPNLKARDEREYLTDRLTDEAEKFIDRNKEKPFFLYLPHYGVHGPLGGKKELIDKYAKTFPSEPANIHTYLAMVQSVDDSVGRLMKKLEDAKIAERTVVIFLSDNGPELVVRGTRPPFRAKKGHLYEGGIRIPLIVHWPGTTKPGSKSQVPVSVEDVAPTLARIAGCPINAKDRDGQSLVPLLEQAGTLERQALYWHYPHYSPQGGRPSGAVRAGDHKLIEFFEDGRLELYDLQADPKEETNLATLQPARAQELRQLLTDWRTRVNAKMPTPATK